MSWADGDKKLGTDNELSFPYELRENSQRRIAGLGRDDHQDRRMRCSFRLMCEAGLFVTQMSHPLKYTLTNDQMSICLYYCNYILMLGKLMDK